MSDASIEIVFSASTGQYIANVEGMDAATAKSAQAVAQAKNLIKAAFAEQAQAAADNGASAQRLADIQTKAAARIAAVTDENANRVINSLNRISEKNKAVAAELGNLKVPEVKENDGVTDRMRASALLRGGGLRAGENFASQFEIFNKVATVAFPVLGLATLTEEAVKFGKEIYDAFDLGGVRARQTASEIQGVDNELRNSGTSLDVQIDKLQQEQAKLEHKPFNGLKLALDEAAEASENLQKHLLENSKAELTVLSGMSASVPQQLLAGGSQNKYEQTMASEHAKWLSVATTTQDELNESTSYGNSLQTRLNELLGKRAQNQEAMESAAANGTPGLLTTYDEEIKSVQTLLKWQGQEHSNIQKTIDLQKQQGATQQARDNHSASGDANKANEQRLKSMEAYVNEWKLLAPVSGQALYDYWDTQKSSFTEGSNEFNAIVAKQATIAEEGARKAHEAITKFLTAQRETANLHAPDQPHTDLLGNDASTRRSLNDEIGKSQLSSDEVSASIAKTKVQIDEANGSISKFAATQQVAAIDADLHAKRIADLNRQIDQLKANSSSYNALTNTFGSDKDQKDYISLQYQITKETGAAQVDAMQNSAKLAGMTWSGALKNANAEWLQDSRNTAQQVTEVFKQAVDGINDELADLITGKKTNWSSLFSGLAKSLATDGLKQGEAGIESLFTPKASTGASGAISGAGGFLASLFGSKKATGVASSAAADADEFGVPAATSTTASSGGGFFSSLFSSLFGGARATGGDVSPGHFYRINEQGEELFAPSTSGKIIPANSWGNGSGNTASYTINVQKGVTPEEFHQGVQSALSQYHIRVMPHAARQAVADGNSRKASR